MGYGYSTNTQADLLALWALLYFSMKIGIQRIHVFGYSMVVIHWAKGCSSLHTLDLEAWCLNIIALCASFSSIDYQHVYREYNERADLLSKEGLHLATSQLSFMEYHEGLVIGLDKMYLF